MKKLFNSLLLFLLGGILFLTTGCQDRDVYDAAYTEQIKSQLFDFNTHQNVQLNVNFNYPGYNVLFGIYDECPATENERGELVSKGLTPLYSAYTDDDSKFSALVNIAATSNKVWFYTDNYGVEVCTELTITNNTLTFEAPSPFGEASASTRDVIHTGPCVPIGANYAEFVTEGSSDYVQCSVYNLSYTRKLKRTVTGGWFLNPTYTYYYDYTFTYNGVDVYEIYTYNKKKYTEVNVSNVTKLSFDTNSDNGQGATGTLDSESYYFVRTIQGGGTNVFRLYSNTASQKDPYNSAVSGLYGNIGENDNISPTGATTSTIGEMQSRVLKGIGGAKKDHSSFVSEDENANVIILSENNGAKVTNAHLDLVFLYANCGYINALGYYYYKTGSNLSGEEIRKLPQYAVFPYCSKVDNYTKRDNYAVGLKARLQFFGEKYDQPGTDDFPGGYTVGWVLYSNLGEVGEALSESNYAKNERLYSNKDANTLTPGNREPKVPIMVLQDDITKKIVIGFEDAWGNNSDRSYDDLMFYVDADPIEAVNPDVPVITDNETFSKDVRSGYYCFEDIWSSGGDYDMNDVIVKYKRVTSFNQENVMRTIEETYTPVHNGATYVDGFGIQLPEAFTKAYNDGWISSVTLNGETVDLTNAANWSTSNVSDTYSGKRLTLKLFDNILEEKNKPTHDYKLVITFRSVAEDIKKGIQKTAYEAVSNDENENRLRNYYNPYIVVENLKRGDKDLEVHMPKYGLTEKGWPGAGSDANLFFVNVTSADGTFDTTNGQQYPFAIDVPYEGFKPTVEAVRIDKAYSKFNNWVLNGVLNNQNTSSDWYKSPIADQTQEFSLNGLSFSK